MFYALTPSKIFFSVGFLHSCSSMNFFQLLQAPGTEAVLIMGGDTIQQLV
jgi:hypothetical protein